MGALSISYAKAAGYTVISTSSPHNFSLLHSLGADHVFDHSDAATIASIRKLFPIDYWFDTISLPASLTAILKILAPPEGEGEYTKADILLLLPPTMPGMPEVPEEVTARFYRWSTHAPENKEWAEWLLARGGFLEEGIKQGIIKGVPPEQIGGLGKVGEGVDRVFKGVSGRKLVVDPWA
jgi:NADPH:quinone reductase-like Zn-dependent oxidoreductase